MADPWFFFLAGGRHLATYSGGSTTFFHTDWLGTKRAMTDPSGNVSETCRVPHPPLLAVRKRSFQNPIDLALFRARESTYSRQDVPRGFGGSLNILSSLIAIRTERPQIFELRLSFLTVRQNVIDVKANFSVRIVCTWVAGSCSAKNTRVAVPLKNLDSELRRNPLTRRQLLQRFEHVFARF